MKRILALVLALMLTMATGASATTLYITGKVSLRTGPGLDYDSQARYGKGDEVEFLGDVEKDERGVEWYYVSAPDGYGWISSKSSTFKAPKSDGEYLGTRYVVNCENWVSLRVRADTSSKRIAKVPKGAVVEAYAYNSTFTLCDYNGMRGYILNEYLGTKKPKVTPVVVTVKPESTSYVEEKYPNGATRAALVGEVTFIEAWASSELTDKYGYYSAANAFDNNTDTAWAEAASDDGLRSAITGSWIAEEAGWVVDGIVLNAGYQKSGTTFKNNNRPRDITVEISSGSFGARAAASRMAVLEDARTQQTVAFDAPVPLDDTVTVTLTINSVYSGSKYTDTCISEIDLLVRKDKSSLIFAPKATSQSSWFLPSPTDDADWFFGEGEGGGSGSNEATLAGEDGSEEASSDVLFDTWAGGYHVVAEHGYNHGESVTVTCDDLSGNRVWDFRADNDEAGQYDGLDAFIGGTAAQPRVMVYSTQTGLSAIDLATGRVDLLLENTDQFSLGGGISHAVTADGTMIIGNPETDPAAISPEGEVLWRADSGSDDIYWLYDIRLGDGTIEAHYEHMPDDSDGWVIYDMDGNALKYVYDGREESARTVAPEPETSEKVSMLGSYDLNLSDQGVTLQAAYERHDRTASWNGVECPMVYDLPILIGSPAGLAAINQALAEDYRDYLDRLEADFAEYASLSPQPENPYVDCNRFQQETVGGNTALTAGVHYYDGGIISFLFVTERCDGGADRYCDAYGRAFDLETGEALSLADLFGDDEETLDALRESVRAAYRDKVKDNGFALGTLENTLADIDLHTQPFCLTRAGNVVLCFERGSLGVGSQESPVVRTNVVYDGETAAE